MSLLLSLTFSTLVSDENVASSSVAVGHVSIII